MRDGRVDGVLGDVALDAEIVVARRILRQRAALQFHLVRALPGAQYHFAHAPHRLRVGRQHGQRAQVVQDILGGDGFAPDARFGKGDVLGDRGIEVVTHHQHVEMLVQRVDGVGPRRIGRGGQHVGFAADLDDVRRMAAARAFGVIGVDGAALECRHRRFDEAGFVQRVGMDRDLRIGVVGHRQAAVDRRGRGAPVLVQLQADRAGRDLFDQGRGLARIALAEKADIDGPAVGRLQHALHMPGAGRAGGGESAGGGAGAAAYHGRHARAQRLVDLLRADEVDVGVDAAGRHYHAFASDHFGRGADRDGHAGLDVGIAGLADRGDAAALDADVGLDDAPMVDDHRIGDHGVDHLRMRALRLTHAVAYHLAAAELHFLAVDRRIALDLDEEVGVGQTQAVAGGGAVHFRVGAAANLKCHGLSLWGIAGWPLTAVP